MSPPLPPPEPIPVLRQGGSDNAPVSQDHLHGSGTSEIEHFEQLVSAAPAEGLFVPDVG